MQKKNNQKYSVDEVNKWVWATATQYTEPLKGQYICVIEMTKNCANRSHKYSIFIEIYS